MSDWEIRAPDTPAMLAAARTLGVDYDVGPDGTSATAEIRLDDGTAVSINFYGTKYRRTGQTHTDAMGDQVPVMEALPGVYAIMRWLGTPFPPDPNPIPDTVTIVPIPADSPVVFAD